MSDGSCVPRGLSLRERCHPSSEELTVFSQHSPWNPSGCLLSNRVPGSSPDRLNEDCWKQGPGMSMSNEIPRWLPRIRKSGDSLIRSDEAASDEVRHLKRNHMPRKENPGLCLEMIKCPRSSSKPSVWKPIVNGNHPVAELLGLWLLRRSHQLEAAGGQRPAFLRRVLGEEPARTAKDSKEQFVQAPRFIGRTPSPGREGGCPRSHGLSKQMHLGWFLIWRHQRLGVSQAHVCSGPCSLSSESIAQSLKCTKVFSQVLSREPFHRLGLRWPGCHRPRAQNLSPEMLPRGTGVHLFLANEPVTWEQLHETLGTSRGGYLCSVFF